MEHQEGCQFIITQLFPKQFIQNAPFYSQLKIPTKYSDHLFCICIILYWCRSPIHVVQIECLIIVVHLFKTLPFLVTAKAAMKPARRGQITRLWIEHMIGWRRPRKMTFHVMLGIRETMGEYVSISKTSIDTRWNMRLTAGTRTGPKRARKRLMVDTGKQTKGKRTQMQRLPNTPFST